MILSPLDIDSENCPLLVMNLKRILFGNSELFNHKMLWLKKKKKNQRIHTCKINLPQNRKSCHSYYLSFESYRNNCENRWMMDQTHPLMLGGVTIETKDIVERLDKFNTCHTGKLRRGKKELIKSI